MVTLCCLVVVDGSIVAIPIDERQLVGELKNAIKAAKSNGIECDADELTLYLAKRGGSTAGGWLSSVQKEDKAAIAALSSPEIPKEFRETYLKDDLKMDPTFDIGAYFDTQKPGPKEIHVLVVVPPPPSKKRKSSDENISWSSLWGYSEMNLTSLPLPKDVAGLLQRPFPFKLDLLDTFVANNLYDDINSPLIKCRVLEAVIDFFTTECDHQVDPQASENTWQKYYDILLSLPRNLCRAKGYTDYEGVKAIYRILLPASRQRIRHHGSKKSGRHYWDHHGETAARLSVSLRWVGATSW